MSKMFCVAPCEKKPGGCRHHTPALGSQAYPPEESKGKSSPVCTRSRQLRSFSRGLASISVGKFSDNLVMRPSEPSGLLGLLNTSRLSRAILASGLRTTRPLTTSSSREQLKAKWRTHSHEHTKPSMARSSGSSLINNHIAAFCDKFHID